MFWLLFGLFVILAIACVILLIPFVLLYYIFGPTFGPIVILMVVISGIVISVYTYLFDENQDIENQYDLAKPLNKYLDEKSYQPTDEELRDREPDRPNHLPPEVQESVNESGASEIPIQSCPFNNTLYSKVTTNQGYINNCVVCGGTIWFAEADFGRYLKCQNCNKTWGTQKIENDSIGQNQRHSIDEWENISHIDEKKYEEHIINKGENTTKLGENCPICGKAQNLYKGYIEDEHVVIFCESCKCVWRKRTGIFTFTKWEINEREMIKTAEEWRNMRN